MLLIQIKCYYDVLYPFFSIISIHQYINTIDFVDATNCSKYSFRKIF